MTKETAKRKAEANGHQLSRFMQRRTQWEGVRNDVIYFVAWCSRCDAACFAQVKPNIGTTNPALERTCQEVRDNG